MKDIRHYAQRYRWERNGEIRSEIRAAILEVASKSENIVRFEGILRVSVVVPYGEMILAFIEVSGYGFRKYYGATNGEEVRFSEESYMDEGHALEWAMWE